MDHRRPSFFRSLGTHPVAHLKVPTIVVVGNIYLFNYSYVNGHFIMGYGRRPRRRSRLLRAIHPLPQRRVHGGHPKMKRNQAPEFSRVA